MAIYLLVMLTAVYFIRPNEWVPSLQSVPLFLITIIPCIAFSLEAIFKQLTSQSLRQNPITFCVAGLLVSTLLSQLANAPAEIATTIGFSKACVFYLLIVSLLETRQHFDWYLRWLGLILLGFASLMELQHYGIIHSDNQATLISIHAGRANAFGSQTFSDPNDSALILIVGLLISIHLASTTNKRLLTLFWLAAAAVSLCAVKITDSRAGFLALSVGTCAYIWVRWGGKWLLRSLCLSPLVIAQIATSRMTDVGAVSEGTGQERVQMWHTALLLFKNNPILGIGPDCFTSLIGKASHNTFLQAYAELGFLGGTLFFFAFYAGVVCAWQTISIIRTEQTATDSNLYLIVALLAAFGVSIFTLNHLYSSESYLVFALTTATLHIERRTCDITSFPWKERFLITLLFSSCLFLLFTKVLAVVLINW